MQRTRELFDLWASLADSTAVVLAAAMWPAATVAVALIFRRSLSRLIRNLRRFKTPAGDMEFDLDEATAIAATLPAVVHFAEDGSKPDETDEVAGQPDSPDPSPTSERPRPPQTHAEPGREQELGLSPRFDYALPNSLARDLEPVMWDFNSDEPLGERALNEFDALRHLTRSVANRHGVGSPAAVGNAVGLVKLGMVHPEFADAFRALGRYSTRTRHLNSSPSDEDAAQFALTARALRNYLVTRANDWKRRSDDERSE